MGRKIAGAIVAGAGVILLLAGCSVAGQPQAAAGPATETVTTTVTQTVTSSRPPATVTETVSVTPTTPAFVPPSGFNDWGEGVATRWTDQSLFNCANSADSCWGVDLYSEPGCPDGVLVVLDISRDGTKIAVIDSVSPAVAAGANVSIVLDQTSLGTGLSGRMADVRCTTA